MIFYLFPLVLIIVGLTNMLILRRKYDRLSIFRHVEKPSAPSLVTQVERNRQNIYNLSPWQKITFWLISLYIILFSKSLKQRRLQNIALLIGGTILGAFVIDYFVKLPLVLSLPSAFVFTLLAMYKVTKIRMKKEFDIMFPEFLNYLQGIILSGGSVLHAFSVCSQKFDGRLGDVLKELTARLNIGEDFEKVLLDSYSKLPFREYYFFILTITVNLQGGGELKEVLSRLAKMIVNSRMLEKILAGKTAEVRMSVKILAAMPVLFLFALRFISPENYQFLMNEATGHYILYFVFGCVGVGVMVIRRMINKAI